MNTKLRTRRKMGNERLRKMEKAPSKTSEYHQMVWQRAKAETEFYFRSDRWAWWGSFITGLVSGIYTLYISNIGDSTIEVVVGVIGVAMGTIFGWAVFVIAQCGYRGLWETPARLYREKQIRADKLTWNDIDIALRKFPPESIFAYGIRFESVKPFIVNHIFAEMTWVREGGYQRVPNPPDRLPIINGREYVWDEGLIDDKGGLITFSLFNVFPEEDNGGKMYRAIIPRSGQPIERQAALDVNTKLNEEAFFEIRYYCTAENQALLPPTITKKYKAWFENEKFCVEEYTEK